jgi:DNA uptake protein ComE-like DNA-binding protein
MTRRRLIGLALVVCLLPACMLWRGRNTGEPPPEAVDLNVAPQWRLERLPGITPSMARRIVEGRPYAEPEELIDRGILTRREFERIEDVVVVSPPKR